MPLSTLHGSPRDDPRKTRGQDGSLLLSCKTLAFSTFCRFSPAHRLWPFRKEPVRWRWPGKWSCLLFLPSLFASVLSAFAPLFSPRVWLHAQVLLLGAILAPGKRTVTSCLRVVGLAGEHRFVNYHRVLSRARWSGRAAGRLLLGLLVRRLVPE